MRVIPAIDIINGKCVRLTKGDYSTQKIYNENPLEVAKMFEAHGITNLHMVDLDGAKTGHIVNYKVLEKIASKTTLKIDFGGGLKSDADLKIAFESGAHQVTGGSIAVKNPALFRSWLDQYGNDKIILGADARDEKIAVGAWLEDSGNDLLPFIQKYIKQGVSYVICTDISKDGMLQGPNYDLYKKILSHPECQPDRVILAGSRRAEKELKLIASGGISCIEDLPKLAALGCEGAIVGKALYEGKMSMKAVENYIVLSTKY